MVSPYCQIEKETSMYDNGAKKKSFHNTVQYMYGVCIPCDMKEALELDEGNCNDNWKKAIRLKIQQLIDHDTFHDKGLIKQMPSDYTKIRCCMTFTVNKMANIKHDSLLVDI